MTVPVRVWVRPVAYEECCVWAEKWSDMENRREKKEYRHVKCCETFEGVDFRAFSMARFLA